MTSLLGIKVPTVRVRHLSAATFDNLGHGQISHSQPIPSTFADHRRPKAPLDFRAPFVVSGATSYLASVSTEYYTAAADNRGRKR